MDTEMILVLCAHHRDGATYVEEAYPDAVRTHVDRFVMGDPPTARVMLMPLHKVLGGGLHGYGAFTLVGSYEARRATDQRSLHAWRIAERTAAFSRPAPTPEGTP